MVTLFGIVEFGEAIRCAREALGSTHAIRLGGLDGMFELPGFPAEVDRETLLSWNPLVAPSRAATWKRGDELLSWGRPVALPSGTSEVTHALVAFDVGPADVQVAGEAIHKAFNSWLKGFEEYVELYTRQRAYAASIVHQQGMGIELLAWDGAGNDVRPRLSSPIGMSITVAGNEVDLTLAQLRSALKMASAGTRPALEYELQLAAYRALRETDYRKAIVETGVAAEILLTGACRDALTGMRVGSQENILRKFRTLGGRVELASVLNVQLPAVDLLESLVKPRNAVTHQGLMADRVMAHAAVSATDALLRALRPLPG